MPRVKATRSEAQPIARGKQLGVVGILGLFADEGVCAASRGTATFAWQCAMRFSRGPEKRQINKPYVYTKDEPYRSSQATDKQESDCPDNRHRTVPHTTRKTEAYTSCSPTVKCT